MPNALQRLIKGFESFHDEYFGADRALFDDLVTKGQQPEVMVVACSDSRVDPAILTRARPGDLFIVRNVAAIVPPYEPDGRHHGTSSALEFGIKGLGVRHIVVLGHEKCGGIRALADRTEGFDFIGDWVDLVAAARDEIDRAHLPEEERLRALEQAAVVTSLRNLMTFPWIRDRAKAGTLKLHGWYFELSEGELLAFDSEANRFAALRDRTRRQRDSLAPPR
jgi:carbonic anhydrase